MRSGLLRVMDIPEKVEGQGRVNIKEQSLRIAKGLYEFKERPNNPFPEEINHAVRNLAPKPGCAGPKYYDEMMGVYDNVWMMIGEIMESPDSNPVYELTKNIEDYMSEAERQKKLSLSRGRK